MARTSPWPTVLGTAALIALPVLAAAQSGQASATGSQASQPKTQSDTKYPVQSGAATQHLNEAKQVLDGIPRNAVTGRNAARLNQIRREFASLRRSYEANPTTSASATSPSASPRTKRTAGHWNEHLMALDRDLTALLGPGTDTGGSQTSTSGTEPQTAATSGTTAPKAAPGASSSAASSLDPNVRSQLEEFRKHISQFAAAASGTEMSGTMGSTDSTASTTSSTTQSSETSQTATSSSVQSNPTPSTQSNPTSSSSTEPGSATGETTQAQASQATSSAQVDAQVARQHLTEARQSLADLTSLPQAQQLQGDARTLVSQLISQFNQLITTQEEWRSSYDQVNATLTTLLSSTSASASSSTQGAVGTSGSASASGMITLDPAIRAKLEQFRTHLNAFYTTAGGSVSAGGSMGATGSTSTSSGSNTSYAGSAAGSTSSPDEAESHIQAIERILDQASGSATGSSSASGSTSTTTGTSSNPAGSTTGTAGSASGAAPSSNASATSRSSVTLTEQQIAQIRMHLQQLRTAIKK